MWARVYWLCVGSAGGFTKKPSDTVHERIDDYELPNIANSSFCDILQAALNNDSRQLGSGRLMPAPLNAARSFVKLINTRRRIMVSQVDTGAHRRMLDMFFWLLTSERTGKRNGWNNFDLLLSSSLILEIRYSQSPSYWGAFCVYNLTSCTLFPYAYNEISTSL